MPRPEDNHSLLSARLNAVRSATCSPSRSITRSCWPARSSKAVPVCGSTRFIIFLYLFLCSLTGGREEGEEAKEKVFSRGKGTFPQPHNWEWPPPILVHRATGI